MPPQKITTQPCPSAKIVNFPQLPPYQAEMFHPPFWSFFLIFQALPCKRGGGGRVPALGFNNMLSLHGHQTKVYLFNGYYLITLCVERKS